MYSFGSFPNQNNYTRRIRYSLGWCQEGKLRSIFLNYIQILRCNLCIQFGMSMLSMEVCMLGNFDFEWSTRLDIRLHSSNLLNKNQQYKKYN